LRPKGFEKIETEKIGVGKHQKSYTRVEQLEEIYLSDQMNGIDSTR
jgi:hypothetical protein